MGVPFLGAVLGCFSGCFGLFLGSFWAVFGLFWAKVAQSGSPFGLFLGGWHKKVIWGNPLSMRRVQKSYVGNVGKKQNFL